MPHRSDRQRDWEDESDFGDEADDDAWQEADEDEPTVPCPYCGHEVHEDTPRCPHCQNYISREDAPPSRKPWWLVVGVAACLYAVYRWIVW
jgi:transposase-like protein